jgi:hypothetical protein
VADFGGESGDNEPSSFDGMRMTEDGTTRGARRTFLVAAGAGAGAAIALVATFAVWFSIDHLPTPPKRWNNSAIKANISSYRITPGKPIQIKIQYQLSNNTEYDYRLPFNANALYAVLPDDNGLENREIEWDTGTLIPARQKVLIVIRFNSVYDSSYTEDNKDNIDMLTTFLKKKLGEISGFRIFDTETRYQIDLPCPAVSSLKFLDNE